MISSRCIGAVSLTSASAGAALHDLLGHQRTGIETHRAALDQLQPAHGDEIRRARSGADEIDGHAASPAICVGHGGAFLPRIAARCVDPGPAVAGRHRRGVGRADHDHGQHVDIIDIERPQRHDADQLALAPQIGGEDHRRRGRTMLEQLASRAQASCVRRFFDTGL
jgi:hypothetical protein